MQTDEREGVVTVLKAWHGPKDTIEMREAGGRHGATSSNEYKNIYQS